MHWQGPSEGRAVTNSTMIGIGLTMEGINQNNMIYEFMLENSWRQRPRNLTEWFGLFSAVLRLPVFTARVAMMYRFCLVCVSSGCQKLIISSLHHILHLPGGLDPFRHVRLSVCPSGPGCLSGLHSTPVSYTHLTLPTILRV